MSCRIRVIEGDITEQAIDAIVNSAHGDLLGGEGVDGAIHNAAGPGLLAECRKIGGCSEGEAKITGSYKLLCKYVVHTVSPHGSGGMQPDELSALKHCYVNSLAIAYAHGCRSIAFPAIGCGHRGFEADIGARIAMRSVQLFLDAHPDMKEVRFVCHPNDHTAQSFEAARRVVFDESHTDRS